MMLTSRQFDALPNTILALYHAYEDAVLADIARRLVKLNLSGAAWQVQRLSESGALYENILKKLAMLTGRSERELAALFQRAGVQSVRFDDKIYREAGLKPLPLNLSPQMAAVLKIGIQRTAGLMRNLTLSTATSGAQAFTQAADVAFLQVSSGTMGYDQAIRNAVKSVGESGLDIFYPTGRIDKLDVAMRRTVLTGVGQVSGELQMKRMDDLGVDLVKVSEHIGSRPTHVPFQGKIFSRNGRSRKYPDFISSTGYGTVTGLQGANCRHTFYPWFEGISQDVYEDAQREEMDRSSVWYQGKEYSTYEATQVQRGFERKIRSWKRQANALGAANLDAAAELQKVRDWQQRMREFIRQTSLSRQYVREQI